MLDHSVTEAGRGSLDRSDLVVVPGRMVVPVAASVAAVPGLMVVADLAETALRTAQCRSNYSYPQHQLSSL